MKETFQNPIHDNLVACLASLHMIAGLDVQTLRFHKEDPKTSHKTCPGIGMNKEILTKDVHNLIVSRESGDHPQTGLPLI